MDVDLKALLEGGQLDSETVENLKASDPEEMRQMLATYLPQDEVERILQRVQELIQAADG